MRAASSYDAIRDSRRESPGRVSECRRFMRLSKPSPSVSACAERNLGGDAGKRSGIGSVAPALMTVPLCDIGRNPDVKLPLALYGSPRGSGITTNVGRLSESEP